MAGMGGLVTAPWPEWQGWPRGSAARFAFRGYQIGPALLRPSQRLLGSPALHVRMVAAAQHLGHGQTSEILRPRKLWKFEQPVVARAEGLDLGRRLVAQHAGHQTCGGL